MTKRRNFMGLAGAAFALAAAALPLPALSDTYPSRPIRLVVPYSPGGAADLVARVLADRMGRSLGQPIVVDNKPGAGAAIASEFVARSTPDGYTVLLGGNTQTVLHPILDVKLNYSDTDFSPIGYVASSPLVMVIDAKSPIKTVDEFVKQMKTSPGAGNYGSSGNGSPMHIAAAWFNSAAGLQMVHVGYKGSPPALNALLSGEIQTIFDLVATAKPLIDSGKLRALAVTTPNRSAVLPDVPTLEESGYKGFDFAVRYALLGPKAMPLAIVNRLNKELNLALREPAVAAQLGNLALDARPGPPDAVTALSATEKVRLRPVIKANNITLAQ